MSKSIKWQIVPKEIDSDGNETALPQYTAITTYTNKAETKRELISAELWVTLPVIADQRAIEFQSDQAVSFSILESGTEVIEFKFCKNLVLVLNKDYTYRVKNVTGTTAKIVWNCYS